MDITVFGTRTCPNCKNVTSFLESKSINYQYKVIGEDVEHMFVNALVGRVVRSVPVVVVNDNEVTFDELQTLVASSEVTDVLPDLEL